MRYRPFRITGSSISALALGPSDPGLNEGARAQLVEAALLAGINAYEVDEADAAAQTALGGALGAYDRELVIVSLRVGPGRSSAGPFVPAAMMAQVEAAQRRLGLGPIDVLMLDRPALDQLTPSLVDALRRGFQAGLYRAVGVRADGPEAERLVRFGAFNVLATRFNLLSGWPERNLIRLAIERGMTVTGYGYIGGELQADGAPASKPKRGLLGFGRPKAPASELQQADGYRFLRDTHGWSDEAICLAYALTEPSLATVQVEPRTLEQLQMLAAVPERDLPSSLTAQIEMARFAKVA